MLITGWRVRRLVGGSPEPDTLADVARHLRNGRRPRLQSPLSPSRPSNITRSHAATMTILMDNLAATAVRCPHCKANIGQRCVTTNGSIYPGVTTAPHSARRVAANVHANKLNMAGVTDLDVWRARRKQAG